MGGRKAIFRCYDGVDDGDDDDDDDDDGDDEDYNVGDGGNDDEQATCRDAKCR